MLVSRKSPVLGPRAKTLSPAHREGQDFSKHLLEGLQKEAGLTEAPHNQEKQERAVERPQLGTDSQRAWNINVNSLCCFPP